MGGKLPVVLNDDIATAESCTINSVACASFLASASSLALHSASSHALH